VARGTVCRARAGLILAAQEPQPEAPAEPEVVTTMKRACKKFSARKQRQIVEFIQVIAMPERRA
jgi:toxic protein SymE